MTTKIQSDGLGIRHDAEGRVCTCGKHHDADPPRVVEEWIPPGQRPTIDPTSPTSVIGRQRELDKRVAAARAQDAAIAAHDTLPEVRALTAPTPTPPELGSLPHSPESFLSHEERALPRWRQPSRRELVRRLRINGRHRKNPRQ